MTRIEKFLATLSVLAGAGVASQLGASEAAEGWTCALIDDESRCYYNCETGGPLGPGDEDICYLANHKWQYQDD
jgi:hypothetical protein